MSSVSAMMLLRFHGPRLLRRCCCSWAYTLVKYQGASISVPGINSIYQNRFLTTGRMLRKDEDAQKGQELDLDIWKSVMRSQAPQEEKVRGEEDNLVEEEGKLSPVEASRRLVEMWRQAGKSVPEHVTEDELETLAELTTKSSKKKYLKYLAIREGYKTAKKEKKEKKKAERTAEEAAKADGENEGEEEGEGEGKLKNTFLLRFWTRSIDKALGWRMAQAMQHGQPLVYDMSYEQHMSRREVENTISQMLEAEGWNRRAVDPFHLHFCNLQPESTYHREFLKRYGQEVWERLLISTTSQRHVDIFPQESLVYLTADSPNVLRRFDHNKVYIVGAMVDRSIQSGVSLANAKRLKLATARLPLDEYLHWETGAKNLTLDQMIRILLTVKETGSWERALEFVPKRKHEGFHQQKRENNTKSASTFKARQPKDTFRGVVGEKAQVFLSKQRAKRPSGGEGDSRPSSQSEHVTNGQIRLRTALKSKMEEKRVTQRRNWWEDD